MTDHNTPSSITKIVTQAVENIQSRVNFNSFSLRQGEAVAEIRVKNGDREEQTPQLKALLEGYQDPAGAQPTTSRDVPVDRIRVYEAMSLARMSVHSWTKNKDERLVVATALLDEVLHDLTGAVTLAGDGTAAGERASEVGRDAAGAR